MIAKIPFLCKLGMHRLERRIHPRNWRSCRRCGHIFFDRTSA